MNAQSSSGVPRKMFTKVVAMPRSTMFPEIFINPKIRPNAMAMAKEIAVTSRVCHKPVINAGMDLTSRSKKLLGCAAVGSAR